MFRIKICGITNAEDAVLAAAAGADAIGVNFYANSPRHVDSATARQVLRAVPKHVARVGVFVNETVENVKKIAARLSLDYIQLHGDEPDSTLPELDPLRVIRAIRAGDDVSQQISDHIATFHRQRCHPAALLIDACEPTAYGGTGKTANWNDVRGITATFSDVTVILAGGLSPDNVLRAIWQARPHAVDVASGVETAPGQKDGHRMIEFVRAARNGFASLAAEPF